MSHISLKNYFGKVIFLKKVLDTLYDLGVASFAMFQNIAPKREKQRKKKKKKDRFGLKRSSKHSKIKRRKK